jgi:hypothetical protein
MHQCIHTFFSHADDTEILRVCILARVYMHDGLLQSIGVSCLIEKFLSHTRIQKRVFERIKPSHGSALMRLIASPADQPLSTCPAKAHQSHTTYMPA